MNTSAHHKSTLPVLVVLASVVTCLLTLWLHARFASSTPDRADGSAGVDATLSSESADAASTSSVEQTVMSLTGRINELEESLSQEQNGRLMLQRALADQKLQLEKLTEEMARLSESAPANVQALAPGTSGDGAPAAAAQSSAVSDIAGGGGFNPNPTVNALVDAGVDETVALDLIARQDARALAELDLRDQAAREGWLDADDFDERLEASLPERLNLRDELDARQWDRYLYASGRPNRIAISSVLNGSAAYNALLQTGDQLLSYAGERVYNVRDLQRGTRGGTRGESVVIQVQRGGEILEMTVPRGPLGVNLSRESVNPDDL